jgi:lysophospholipase L1-like esterase
MSFRHRPAIILFGDSITQDGFGDLCLDDDGGGGGDEAGGGSGGPGVGWASLLASAYSRRADVLNRGYSGYNTDHYLEILPRILGQRAREGGTGEGASSASAWDARGTIGPSDVLFCTVFLGANDAALPGEPQHVPIDRYRRNLQSIVREIRRATAPAGPEGGGAADMDEQSSRERAFPIVLCTPPPVDEGMWRRSRSLGRSDRTNRRTRSYGACARQVAEMTAHCACLDVWELLGGDDPATLSGYLSDGLHLNSRGNAELYRGLMRLVAERFPHLAPAAEGEEGPPGGVPPEEEPWRVRCGVAPPPGTAP